MATSLDPTNGSIAAAPTEKRRHAVDVVGALVERVRAATMLDSVAEPIQQALTRWIPGGSSMKELLSGSSVGHPLHPILTDIPIGSLASATVLDLVGGRQSRRAAGILVVVGLVSSVPTAAAGLADWSDLRRHDKRVGVVHAAANSAGLGLYTLSLLARLRGRKLKGVSLGLMGLGVMTVGGYLGGDLVFDGDSRSDGKSGPDGLAVALLAHSPGAR
jgi:uncharacterized membrane protein